LRGLWKRRLAKIAGSDAAAHVGQGVASRRPGVRCGYARVMKFIDGSAKMKSDKELSNVAMTKMVAKE
jgi:hypothetical protein